MKSFFSAVLVVLVFSFIGFNQASAQVGIGTTTPSPNAVLELKSPGNNQGFLVPRMTTAQRTAAAFVSALSVAEAGLLVFDTDDDKFYYWSGTAWIVIEDSVGTGTVTNILTGAGLSGGPITVTGTISLADNGVTTVKIADGNVTSAKIADGTVATADLADGSVTSAKVLDGTIATVDMANTSVTDAKIASGVTVSKLSPSVTNGQVLTTVGGTTQWANASTGTVTNIATGTGLTGGPITGTGTISIAANGITATELRSDAATDANRAVTTNHIRDNAITTGKIADGTIATADLADASVTTAKVVDGTLTNVDINNSAAIAVSKVAAGTNGQVLLTTAGVPTWSTMPAPTGAAGGDLTGSYPSPTVAAGAITSLKILDATVATADLADGSVTSAKVLDGTLATADLSDGAVTTAKILDATIATTDLADGSVTTAKILDGTVATADIGNTQVTDVKLASGITVSKLSPSVTNGQVLTTVAGGTQWANAATGTVTNIVTGTGLTGGPITGTGTISIAANGVTATELRSDATTDANRSVTTNHIRDNAVTTGKIADATIATADLSDGSVNSAKILDGAIANADVSATAAVAVSKLAAGTNTQVLTTVAGVPTWQAPADNSATNEIQSLSIAGTSLTISGGNTVTLPSGGGVSGSGTSGQLAIWSGSSSITGNSNLVWDEKDNLLGVGLTPKTTLHVGGSHAVTFTVAEAGDYEIKPKDYVIFVPSATNNIMLPEAAEIPGRILIIRSTDQDKGVTIRALNGKDLIDGATIMQLFDRAGEFYTVTLISNGNNWFSISKSSK